MRSDGPHGAEDEESQRVPDGEPDGEQLPAYAEGSLAHEAQQHQLDSKNTPPPQPDSKLIYPYDPEDEHDQVDEKQPVKNQTQQKPKHDHTLAYRWKCEDYCRLVSSIAVSCALAAALFCLFWIHDVRPNNRFAVQIELPSAVEMVNLHTRYRFDMMGVCEGKRETSDDISTNLDNCSYAHFPYFDYNIPSDYFDVKLPNILAEAESILNDMTSIGKLGISAAKSIATQIESALPTITSALGQVTQAQQITQAVQITNVAKITNLFGRQNEIAPDPTAAPTIPSPAAENSLVKRDFPLDIKGDVEKIRYMFDIIKKALHIVSFLFRSICTTLLACIFGFASASLLRVIIVSHRCARHFECFSKNKHAQERHGVITWFCDAGVAFCVVLPMFFFAAFALAFSVAHQFFFRKRQGDLDALDFKAPADVRLSIGADLPWLYPLVFFASLTAACFMPIVWHCMRCCCSVCPCFAPLCCCLRACKSMKLLAKLCKPCDKAAKLAFNHKHSDTKRFSDRYFRRMHECYAGSCTKLCGHGPKGSSAARLCVRPVGSHERGRCIDVCLRWMHSHLPHGWFDESQIAIKGHWDHVKKLRDKKAFEVAHAGVKQAAKKIGHHVVSREAYNMMHQDRHPTAQEESSGASPPIYDVAAPEGRPVAPPEYGHEPGTTNPQDRKRRPSDQTSADEHNE